jgi:hypothetical protein
MGGRVVLIYILIKSGINLHIQVTQIQTSLSEYFTHTTSPN